MELHLPPRQRKAMKKIPHQDSDEDFGNNKSKKKAGKKRGEESEEEEMDEESEDSDDSDDSEENLKFSGGRKGRPKKDGKEKVSYFASEALFCWVPTFGFRFRLPY